MKIRVYVADVWAETFCVDESMNLDDEVVDLFCKDFELKQTDEIRNLILSSATPLYLYGKDHRILHRKASETK